MQLSSWQHALKGEAHLLPSPVDTCLSRHTAATIATRLPGYPHRAVQRPGRASWSRRLPQNLPPVVSPSRCPARPACRDIPHGWKKRGKQAYRHCTSCWKPGRRARFGGGTELAGCQALHWARQLQSRPAHLQVSCQRQHLNLTTNGGAHATLGGAAYSAPTEMRCHRRPRACAASSRCSAPCALVGVLVITLRLYKRQFLCSITQHSPLQHTPPRSSAAMRSSLPLCPAVPRLHVMRECCRAAAAGHQAAAAGCRARQRKWCSGDAGRGSA